MKKIMMIGSVLLTLSSSAFASQARLLALGMNEIDNDGMYYISDSRNIFLNVANINLYPNQVDLDWGKVGAYGAVISGTTSTATLTATTAPKAQGGVFKKYGDYVYGVYYGNESNTSSLLRIGATSSAATVNATGNFPAIVSKMLPTADNQIDVFFGGDNGIKWGFNALYAGAKDESRNAKDSAAAIRGGLIGNNWDAHLNLSLNSKSETNESVNPLNSGASVVNSKFDGKVGVHVGGAYEILPNQKVFGYFKYFGWEQTDSFNKYTALNASASVRTAAHITSVGGQNGTIKGNFSSFYVGWGSDFDVNKTDKLFTSVALKNTSVNLNFTNKSEIKNLVVPVTLGYEAKAVDWLTLRGSVVQNLYGQQDNKHEENLNPISKSLIAQTFGSNGKKTIASSTTVKAGATLTFGTLSIDGLVGETSSLDANGSKKGILSASNLETSVGLTYKY